MAKLGRVLGRSHYSLCDLLAPDYGQTIIASLTRPRVVRLESLDQVKPRLAAQVGRYAGVNNCETMGCFFPGRESTSLLV